MIEVVVEKRAEKALLDMDRGSQNRVIKAIDSLSEKGLSSSNVRSLSGMKGVFRKRVGRWRILFTYEKAGPLLRIWIIALEKSTKKDYTQWLKYVISSSNLNR